MKSTIINTLKLSSGVISSVKSEWQIVQLPFIYNEMVVVATPCYERSKAGAIAQVRNAERYSNTFEVRVETPNTDLNQEYIINYIAVESGVFHCEKTGFQIESHRVTSKFADKTGKWIGQKFTTHKGYASPVVLGQVMSANDAWSVFWAKAGSIQPLSHHNHLIIGRHQGEDKEQRLRQEELGIIVIEEGAGEINGIQFEAGVTGKVVTGRNVAIPLTNFAKPYEQRLRIQGITAVASMASMIETDGCWPVLWGNNEVAPFQSRKLRLNVDEDQIKDSEQMHRAEKVSFFVLNGEKDSSRFLRQAGFGGHTSLFQEVFRKGYATWINEQREEPISFTTPYMEDLVKIQCKYPSSITFETETGNESSEKCRIRLSYPFAFNFPDQGAPASLNFPTPWIRNIIDNKDQLRQRVTWALSQIFVVSYNSTQLKNVGRSIADYYDTLAKYSLGNYFDLLVAISLHPAMAFFLSSLGNQKAHDNGKLQPDENYAREVMQLFSIGLWELEINGSLKEDENGNPIPTYTNKDVEEMARVFTGLWFEEEESDVQAPFSGEVSFRMMRLAMGGVKENGESFEFLTQLRPLKVFLDFHDSGSKVLFHNKDYETILPQNNENDIEDALNILFHHPNTAPFISRRLINFMVTSNPSPNYIERVAKTFIDNGKGERGDLHAVVKQILLDPEARFYDLDGKRNGRLNGPMFRFAMLTKAFQAGLDLNVHPPITDGNFEDDRPGGREIYFYRGSFSEITEFGGQWPMYSPSVFNFYEPDYQHPGELADQDLYSPEFQILNAVSVVNFPNEVMEMIDHKIQNQKPSVTPEFKFDFSEEIKLAHDSKKLLDQLNTLLTYGQMSTSTYRVIERVIADLPSDTKSERLDIVKVAVWGILVSPDSAITK